MKVKALLGDPFALETDGLILTVYENQERWTGGLAKADRLLGGKLRDLQKWGEVRGKASEVTIVHTLGQMKPRRLVLVGVGKRDDASLESFRRAMGSVVRALNRIRARTAHWLMEATEGTDIGDLSRALTEAALLANYRYSRKTEGDTAPTLESLHLITLDRSARSAVEQGVETGTIVGEATNRTRDLVNAPPIEMTPTALAEAAVEVARLRSLDCSVYDEKWIEEMGMNALRAVSLGSAQNPRFVVLQYRGHESAPVLALVGKGITFDSGGLCLKPADSMLDMKGDMSGAAAVIGAFDAIGRLQPKANVLGVIPATENMPGGGAFKPGDILKTYLGKTVEIINTDAEGRLILADALAYAVNQGASSILDAATLTGAAMIAVGPVCTAAFSNNEDLLNEVTHIGRKMGELLWPMPLLEDYKKLIDGDFADIKNSGGRQGGAITAAWFLAHFVGKVPWVHLDIAPTFWSDREEGYLGKGATGVAVRTFVQWVLERSDKDREG
ncbi:MAG: leucyl aminopeptidase [Armatimonadetes bacterium]|nr:leucyl aminopeptidase [Armatimonadota bacterium]MDW8122291.1 leucyl aminopeptidase [Armatimonadota bacterium]